MGTLLTTRILTGIGDASPTEDEDPPPCKTCNGTSLVACSDCGGDDPSCVTCMYSGQTTCPGCNGTGYRNTEPDPDVGLDWVP